MSGADDQEEWFTTRAGYWHDVYQAEDLDAQIYRRRLATTVRWIDDLALPDKSKVLDAGCGAGHLAVALARRGALVAATDLSAEMLGMTRDHMDAERVQGVIARADSHQLPFTDGAFDVVVALGLLPWVTSPDSVLTELARVTAEHGHVIVSFDNENRLFGLTDPRQSILTQPVRRLLRRVRGPARRHVRNRLVRPRHGRAALQAVGLQIVETASVGFGGPTFFGRPITSQRLAMRIDSGLQRRADQDPSILSEVGTQYLILARR